MTAPSLTILGSGSAGNCAYLEDGETRILIDAGFSARQIRERMATIGRAPEGLTGILITHEHGDHVQGLGVLASKTGTAIYCNRFTREAIESQFPGVRFDFRVFETGRDFSVGSLGVENFSIPHDAMDPVGYVIHTTAGSVGFLTDLGHATRMILDRVRRSRVLVLESNYDVRMLQDDTRRPWSTKQRILSRHGHLSNDAAAGVAVSLMEMGAGLERLFLGHLSRDCNRPALAEKTVRAGLQKVGASQVIVEMTSQDSPSPGRVIGEAAGGSCALPEGQKPANEGMGGATVAKAGGAIGGPP